MKTKSLIATLLGIGIVVPVAISQTTRWGYESAPYTVVEKDGVFEIRDYPGLVVVETVDPPDSGRGGQSFNRLFRYISGHNGTDDKIAMTTPVYFRGEADNRTMAFVLPAAMSLEEAPEPRDPSVKLGVIPGARYVAMRYSGGRSERREREALSKIRLRAEEHRLETLGDPVFGYYDPPWTPGFMRRNEVMLRLAPMGS